MTRLLPFAVSCLGLLALWGSAELVALAALVLATGTLVPAGTSLRAAALAVPVLAGALCGWLTLASVLSIHNHPGALLAVALVVVGVLSLRRRPPRPIAVPLDLVAAAVALASFLLVYRPFAGVSTGTRLALLSRTTDSGTHFEMVRAVARHGGYLALIPDLDASATRRVQHYPPAFSGVVGTLVDLVQGPSASLPSFVHLTVVAVCALFGVLAWFLTQLAGSVLPALHRRGPELVVLGAAGLGLTVLGPTALLLSDGAYAQLLALLALAAALLLVSADAGRGPATTAALSLATVTGMHAWYLVAPAFGVPWLLHAVAVRNRLQVVVGSVLTTVAAAYPLAIGPGRAQLHVVGFIDLPQVTSNAALLAAAAASLAVVVLTPRGRELRLPLLATTVVLLLGSVLLGAGQIVLTGSLSYYFFKSLVGAAAFGTALLAGAAALAVTQLQESAGIRFRTAALSTALVVLLVPLLVLLGDSATRAPVFGSAPQQIAGGLQKTRAERALRGLPQRDVVRLLDRILDDHPNGVDAAHDVWFVGCSRAQMYVLDKWLYDLSLTWTPPRQYLIDSLRFESRNLVQDLERRATDPGLVSLEIYHDDTCPPATLGDLASHPNVRLVGLT